MVYYNWQSEGWQDDDDPDFFFDMTPEGGVDPEEYHTRDDFYRDYPWARYNTLSDYYLDYPNEKPEAHGS